MIHAFALEPKLVARWGRREEFHFIRDKFGLGTPRVLLELPQFSKWRKLVHAEANGLNLSDLDKTRIAELFRIFDEHKCRRADSPYDGLLPWLENAEREYDRKPFAAIVATNNPRAHPAVLNGDQLVPGTGWDCPTAATPSRTSESFVAALSPMLVNCKVLHLVDPHFGPENIRHRKVLEALTDVLASRGVPPDVIRVHCSAKSPLTFFEQESAKMAQRLLVGISIEFVRWVSRDGGERLHNRYVLTDLGGISVAGGLDEGRPGETDDLFLLSREQYELRWRQYVSDNGAFDLVDGPATVKGRRPQQGPKG